MTRLSFLLSIVALAGLASCQPKPGDRTDQADGMADTTVPQLDSTMARADTGIASGEWSLVSLGGEPAPLGAGDRPATLAFAPDTNLVSGFSGCNRIGGSYALNGDSIQFSYMHMTRMACDKGMDLEQQFAATIDSARTWRRTADTLELMGGTGEVIARLERRPT